MKYIYLVRRGDLNKSTNIFEFWNNNIFSSKNKALQSIENSINVNKGFNVVNEPNNSIWIQCTDFNTLSTDNEVMTIRLIVERHEIR